MNDLFEEPDDATPLTAEERADLIPAHIAYPMSQDPAPTLSAYLLAEAAKFFL